MVITSRIAGRSNSDHLMFEEFVPSSGWSEDSNNHLLIIDLPGFRMEDVKLHIDDYGRVVARGERQVKENKHIHFEQSFKIPENSTIDDTTAKFDDEILYIIIPKKKQITGPENRHLNNATSTAELENQHDQTLKEDHENAVEEDDNKSDGSAESDGRDDHQNGGGEMTGNSEGGDQKFYDARFIAYQQVYDESPLRKVGMKLKRHKGIIITAIVAFSLGFIVSNKFQSNQK